MEKKKYTILTDGRFVAGIKNPGVGETIELTALQAEHPIRIGEIADPDAPVVVAEVPIEAPAPKEVVKAKAPEPAPVDPKPAA